MSQTVNVRSIQALDEWKIALKRYVGKVWEVLHVAEQEVLHTEEWLQERLIYWHHKVEECHENVQEAKRELRSCEESSDDDYYSDCSAEEEALIQAQHHLQEAQAELKNTRRWIHQVSEMVTAYRAQANRLAGTLTNDIPRADVFLERVITDLQAYLAVAPQVGRAGIASPMPSPPTVGTGTAEKATSWNIAGTMDTLNWLL